jgi:hypothetical protein
MLFEWSFLWWKTIYCWDLISRICELGIGAFYHCIIWHYATIASPKFGLICSVLQYGYLIVIEFENSLNPYEKIEKFI